MTDLYLENIGLARPTIVKRDNSGEIERLESRGLDMASLVAFWRRCFGLNDRLFEKIILHCKSKDFNAMGGRTLAQCRSVRELLAEQGVECVVDDEWFKGKEENDYKQRLASSEERYEQLSKTSYEAVVKKNNRIKELQAENEKLKVEAGSKAVMEFIMKATFKLGSKYGDGPIGDLAVEDIMDELMELYKEIYTK